MLAELSQGRSCGQTARGGRASVCRVEFSYPVPRTVTTSRGGNDTRDSADTLGDTYDTIPPLVHVFTPPHSRIHSIFFWSAARHHLI